ncbi:MAG: acyl-CoA dehydrogenase family protein [candidate division WOR-3 bacterium]|nr:acyl-CoA dehydrogenase family protein [candidate division WOR-3 bacterium]MCX7948306.1 acyl-CoA dehydrogenase family protein [candidate division WOR-3 bacterium]MDW8151148.1 acyl-CoA dehydrogenase family protein [candidate division WOR-3 bacterium]
MTKIIKGGEFLVSETDLEDIFIPEEFTEEDKIIAKSASDFMEKEVLPYDREIESKNLELLKRVLKKSAEYGFTGCEIPEKYGGMPLDKKRSMILAEKFSIQSSFAITWGVQIGIGSLPIVYFGNDEQKRKYLPKIANAEIIGAYALTEPCCGSDAMNIKTKAILDNDHWIINGQKIFITNGGIADFFIVFARAIVNSEDKGITAFIVERDREGFHIGSEYHKMGMVGSSTVPLFFDNVKIPLENQLYEIGKGHKIAFGILNIGRYKLGASTIGSAKYLLSLGIKYAKERTAFNKSISDFELIREKIAKITSYIYVGESASYRVAGYMDRYIKEDVEPSEAIERIAEYSVEHSIIKVFGSEVLDYAVDEILQIYGGYGYIEDYPASRAYRDSRINRIWEGTNEINRQVITGMLLKKALKNELPLIPLALKFANDVVSYIPEIPEQGFLKREKFAIDIFKKIFLMVSALAVQKYGENIKDAQIVSSSIADIVSHIFLLESGYLRVMKILKMGDVKLAEDAAKLVELYTYYALGDIENKAIKVLSSLFSGDEQRMYISTLRKLIRWYEFPNYSKLVNDIAMKVIERNGYFLNTI